MNILTKFLLVTALTALMACNTSGSSDDEIIVAITLPIRQVGPNGNPEQVNFARGLAYGQTDPDEAFESLMRNPISPALLIHAADLGYVFPDGKEVVVRITPAQFGRLLQWSSNSNNQASPLSRGPGHDNNEVWDFRIEHTDFTDIRFFRMASEWQGYDWTVFDTEDTAADFLNTPFPINAFGGGVINYTINRRSTPAFSPAAIAAMPEAGSGGTGAPSVDAARQIGFILVGTRSAFEEWNLIVAESVDADGRPILR
ncbi:MAG: hypothetical protein FWE37_08985 [Spirochaetaceae bacterium]|nr:hypothetical protein [Spirochaetaceae bacterium]